MKNFTLVVSVLCMMGCRMSKPATSNDQTWRATAPAWGALWQQKAGEYKALCYQAFNLAQLRLDQILQQPHAKPLAIVTDIDETILDNSPYIVHDAFRNSLYTDSAWMEWTNKVACDTVPGALAFLQYAKSKGVEVFYITNRLEAERSATLKELVRYNFPNAESKNLQMKTTASGKEPRREHVANTHDIVLLLGDNLSDFDRLFDKQTIDKRNADVIANRAKFGERFIVLPNAMYGDWEGGLIRFQYSLSLKQQDSIFKASLRNY
ncbi:5'-nucleotidase (lipoprotein e(P4) family) [Chitinophaga skermanii]|uniref:5'-nucleotidase (Lipoprotein e(P4) family) n=1 Tax=Chitinophaga skermanii TaxID=331697 RepID=A0A327QI02_9BACT|nr:5'-nucleotidase, lipoprotein e(P4) family [Chitinophaga skermanii]RAJ04040.1 5'-nucleotidase (lipoprotein e(P4) family) [Chitinophaga skermanii]